MNSFRSVAGRIFGIDARSLALFRVMLALVLLSDLWLRIANLGAFYTDAGVLPRAAQIEIYAGLPALFSLHLMSGTLGGQGVLLAIQVVAALALLVGYRTGIATFVSWIMLVSLHNRNPMVVQGGDVLLRLLLFWSLFLPLNARASIDRWRTNSPVEKPSKAPLFSVATVAVLLQVCFVYWFTAALKTDASWRVDGTAIGYALSIDQLSRPLGRALLHYPDALRTLTFATINLERCGPLLALLPFWRVRLLMVAIFVGFHFVMGLCLTLGVFTFVAPAAWLLFVPAEFWDFIGRRFRSLGARIGKVMMRTRAYFAARGLAVRQIPCWRGMVQQSLAGFFLLYVFAWNFRALDFNRYQPYFPQSWNWIGETLRIDQIWNMFAPFPLKEDGWLVAAATLQDGHKINLISGENLSWAEPGNLSGRFADAQWQKYLLNLWPVENAPHRGYYVAYLMRQWNGSHAPAERVKTLDLVYMQQDNLPGFRKAKARKIVLWNAKY